MPWSTCSANQTVYVHALQPNQYVEGSKPLREAEWKTGYRENHPYRPGVENGYPRLIAAGTELSRQGVNFLDLTGACADVHEQIYVDDCCHVNERGNAILVPLLLEAILTGQREPRQQFEPLN